MKKLNDYNLITEFLEDQGLRPTVAMICAEDPKWDDLVSLAEEWKTQQKEDADQQILALDGLSEEEKGHKERYDKESEAFAAKRLLFHSSGHKPERDVP